MKGGTNVQMNEFLFFQCGSGRGWAGFGRVGVGVGVMRDRITGLPMLKKGRAFIISANATAFITGYSGTQIYTLICCVIFQN